MPNRRIELIGFVIDANQINANKKLPNMTKIENWHRDGVISLVISDIAFDEVGEGGLHGSRRRDKALDLIMTGTRKLRTADEFMVLKTIEDTLFPAGAKAKNEVNDVWIVYNAHKYGDILITNDRRHILNKRESLLALGVFGIKTDVEAVSYIREQIQFRDEQARFVGSLSGAGLPSWVGQD